MIAVHTRSWVMRLVVVTATAAIVASAAAAAPPASRLPLQPVVSNDNRHPAGTLDRGTLTLALRAGHGAWHPEGPAGPMLSIEAFGELSSALSVPAPLIRVAEGTLIVASVRNDLDAVLHVLGLCTHGDTPCSPLVVMPGDTSEVRFSSGPAGTYHYWATTMGLPVPFRELSGGFIVDKPGSGAEMDRVLVITEWNDLTPQQLRTVLAADDPGSVFATLQPRLTFVINGLSWPASERLTYQLGDHVRWRVINLSSQAHPLHLHGFYFEVDSLGDGWRDLPIDPGDRHPVVTQLIPPGSTMSMMWTAERPGNWLFHCHIMNHVSPQRQLSEEAQPGGHHPHHGNAGGMAGMILGITIAGSAAPAADSTPEHRLPRKLTLVMAPGPAGRDPSLGFTLSGDGVAAPSRSDDVSTPGPTLVLRRNEPVEITVVNRLGESTALHWHGMELDSFYDGVHGWSGSGGSLASLIEPDQSFVVRFTPPRAGTFMYHTHVHDERQLPLGLYGPIIVTDGEGRSIRRPTTC